MASISDDELTILLLQRSVINTMLSDAKFQKAGTPQALIKSILGIITSDRPKTYLLWGTSIKEKLFLYALYKNVFQDTPELNNFLASTSLSEKKQYGLKAAKELERTITSNSSTAELNQCLQKIVASIGSNPGGPPTHW